MSLAGRVNPRPPPIRIDQPIHRDADDIRRGYRILSIRSRCRPKGILHRFRMLGDDREKHSRRAIGTCAALLPISNRRHREPEARRELRLAQFQLSPHSPHVNERHMNLCHPYGDIQAAGLGRALPSYSQ